MTNIVIFSVMRTDDEVGELEIVWEALDGPEVIRGWLNGPTGWFSIEGKVSS
jgi:hypothetical protein